MGSSKFHFKEINLVIHVPKKGNKNRSVQKYGVKYLDRFNMISQEGKAVNLEDVLNLPRIRDNFPHTIGYYLKSKGRGSSFAPEYLRERIVGDNEEFYRFLSDLNVGRLLS